MQWWRSAVKNRGNPEKKSAKLKSAERGALTLEQAEHLTKISHQQVSKWAKRLHLRYARASMTSQERASLQEQHLADARQHLRRSLAAVEAAGTFSHGSRRTRAVVQLYSDLCEAEVAIRGLQRVVSVR